MPKAAPQTRTGRGRPDDELGTAPEVAGYLGIPEQTLAQWRYLGRGPRFIRVGRYVRYRWTDIANWLEENASEPRIGVGAAGDAVDPRIRVEPVRGQPVVGRARHPAGPRPGRRQGADRVA